MSASVSSPSSPRRFSSCDWHFSKIILRGCILSDGAKDREHRKVMGLDLASGSLAGNGAESCGAALFLQRVFKEMNAAGFREGQMPGRSAP